MAKEYIADQKSTSEQSQSVMLSNLVQSFSTPELPIKKDRPGAPSYIAYPLSKGKNAQESLISKANADNKLNLILNTPELLKAFKEFLKKEVSTENLAFALAVDAVSKAAEKYSPDALQAKLKTLHKYYIQADAKFLVNLPDELRAKCQALPSINHQAKMTEPKFELQAYKNAAENIKKLMKDDTIPRFMAEQEKNHNPITRPRR